MNYQKIYEHIIEKAKIKNRQKGKKIYYENHHIKPKCLNGLDEDKNLVLLTAKEHFICHKLLTKIYPDNRDLATAFHFMVYGNNDYKNTARDYEYARELISKIGLSEETKEKISKAGEGRLHTDEAKRKMSEALKGKPAPNKGKKMSDEQKKKISRANEGRKHTEETRKKMSISAKNRPEISEKTRKKMSIIRTGKLNPMAGKWGENNPNYGSRRSDETKQKQSESRKKYFLNEKFIWITDEKEIKMIKEEAFIPNGWRRGRPKKK
jgi:hypothetical protein